MIGWSNKEIKRVLDELRIFAMELNCI